MNPLLRFHEPGRSVHIFDTNVCVCVCVSIFISQLQSFKMHTDNKTMTGIYLVALFIAVINNISTCLMFVWCRLLSQGSVHSENT